MVLHAVYLLLLLLFPFALHLIVRRLRRGQVVAGGTVRIRKDHDSNTFKSFARLNGVEVEAMFDTGASETTVGIDLAERLGFDTSTLYFDTAANTAAGIKHAALAKVSINTFEVGPIVIEKLGVSVNRFDADSCLVGMNFFDALDFFQIADGVLTLRKERVDRELPANSEVAEATRDPEPPQGRIPAQCPYCEAAMTLPMGRSGTVRCHVCDRLFVADTTVNEDGKATCSRSP